MKTIGYTALHYGKTYLAASIRSVIDHIDEYHVLYAKQPSHGTRVNMPCPETEDELHAIAMKAAGDKLRWHSDDWKHEGEQRNAIYKFAPDADVILNVDSDEIWTDKVFDLLQSERGYQGAYIALPLVHFWRSFYKAVTNDPAAPARILFPRATRKDWHLIANLDTPLIHLGYAQPPEITKYKSLIHGHRSDWRADWYDTKFLPNAQIDVHPTNFNYWNPVDVNPLDYMPAWMSEHPSYHKALIE